MSLLGGIQRRYQLLRHKPWRWRLRPGTIDRRLFRDVVIRNEYRLCERFEPDDVIVDVGAHTGAFALAVLRRGAGRVFCYEADANNFCLLERNLRGHGPRVCIYNRIVWRSDLAVADLPFANHADKRNTGAGAVAEAGAKACRVATVAFDELVANASENGQRRIRLVKLDCEGAEWPILLTARHLDCIDAICGEYHLGSFPECYQVAGAGTFSTALLEKHLTSQGFQVSCQPTVLEPGQTTLSGLGLFFATRKSRLIGSKSRSPNL
ncbi:MAG: FkbM family methyltransferase [Planctomycetes bacterium]|nr:FkbM family methyltransferase [Planctomycetota bacterium]